MPFRETDRAGRTLGTCLRLLTDAAADAAGMEAPRYMSHTVRAMALTVSVSEDGGHALACSREHGLLRGKGRSRIMSTIKGYSHIHLYVRDPERSALFYGSVFGFEEKFRVGDQLFVATPDDGAWLTFHMSDSEMVGSMGGIAHFGFERADSDDIEEAVLSRWNGQGEASWSAASISRGFPMPWVPIRMATFSRFELPTPHRPGL
ncbi:MAG: VOC family protein [Chloroflexota bacterium]